MKYLDTKKDSLEDSVVRVVIGEKLVGGQKKLDKDKDGDIDGKDFAMLRKAAAKKKKSEETEITVKEYKEIYSSLLTMEEDELEDILDELDEDGLNAISEMLNPENKTLTVEGIFSKIGKGIRAVGRGIKKIATKRGRQDIRTGRMQKKIAKLQKKDTAKKTKQRDQRKSDAAFKKAKADLARARQGQFGPAKKKPAAKKPAPKTRRQRVAASYNPELKEGTWAMPDSPKLKMGLKKALQRPIMLGKEGDDATDTIRSFIGDDELYDDLYAAGMKNPKGDARPIIKAAMKRLGIKEDVELDENMREIEKMMKDRKYKGNTSAFDAAVKKKFPRDYKKDDVQDIIRKHAEMNEKLDDEDESTVKKVVAKLKKASQAHADQAKTLTKDLQDETDLNENFRKLAMMGIGTETKRGARVGLTTDYYLPDNGDKSTGKIIRVSKDGYEIKNDGDLTPRLKGKIHKFKFYDPTSDKTSVRGMRKENYEIGNDYAKHTLRVTPGQSENDVDEMLGIAQKKNMSMREALAKVWGLDEGKNPFKKENMKVEKKKMGVGEKKTMTGKEPTEVEVDPKVEKK